MRFLVISDNVWNSSTYLSKLLYPTNRPQMPPCDPQSAGCFFRHCAVYICGEQWKLQSLRFPFEILFVLYSGHIGRSFLHSLHPPTLASSSSNPIHNLALLPDKNHAVCLNRNNNRGDETGLVEWTGRRPSPPPIGNKDDDVARGETLGLLL